MGKSDPLCPSRPTTVNEMAWLVQSLGLKLSREIVHRVGIIWTGHLLSCEGQRIKMDIAKAPTILEKVKV